MKPVLAMVLLATTTAMVLLATTTAMAVDQKSLLLGVGIGLGVYTVQKGVVPVLATVGRATVKAPKVVGRGVKRVVLGPKKKAPRPPVAE